MNRVCQYVWRLAEMCIVLVTTRLEFDEDRMPALTDDIFMRDIHSISSLLKMYFRELPNPLLTYQLYDKFVVRTRFDRLMFY